VVEDGSQQGVVNGYVANEGTAGGATTVMIAAYGGPPDNDTEPWDIANAYKQGYRRRRLD
jgi:hypothetical protein